MQEHMNKMQEIIDGLPGEFQRRLVEDFKVEGREVTPLQMKDALENVVSSPAIPPTALPLPFPLGNIIARLTTISFPPSFSWAQGCPRRLERLRATSATSLLPFKWPR